MDVAGRREERFGDFVARLPLNFIRPNAGHGFSAVVFCLQRAVGAEGPKTFAGANQDLRRIDEDCR